MSSNGKIPTVKIMDYCIDFGIVNLKFTRYPIGEIPEKKTGDIGPFSLNENIVSITQGLSYKYDEEDYSLPLHKRRPEEKIKERNVFSFVNQEIDYSELFWNPNTLLIKYEFMEQNTFQPEFTEHAICAIPKYKPYPDDGFYWYLTLDPDKYNVYWVHNALMRKIETHQEYFISLLTPQNFFIEKTKCTSCRANIIFYIPLNPFPDVVPPRKLFTPKTSSFFQSIHGQELINQNLDTVSIPPQGLGPAFSYRVIKENFQENFIHYSQIYSAKLDEHYYTEEGERVDYENYFQPCPTCGVDFPAKDLANPFLDEDPFEGEKSFEEVRWQINGRSNVLAYSNLIFPQSSLYLIEIPEKPLEDQMKEYEDMENWQENQIKEIKQFQERPFKKTFQIPLQKLVQEIESKVHEKKSTLFTGTDPKRPFYQERFKRKESNFIDKAISTISAFANTTGGTLVIGVNEKNNNEIVGIEVDIKFAENIEDLDEWKRQFVDLLDGIKPVEYRDLILQNYKYHTIDEKTILEIQCPLHDKPAYPVSYTGGKKAHNEYVEKRYYKRKGPASIRMSEDDLIAHMRKNQNKKIK